MKEKAGIAKLAAGIFLGGVIALALAYYVSTQNAAQENTGAPRLAATMQGFAPGAQVTYRVISAEGRAVSGNAKVGEEGSLEIPVLEEMKDGPGRVVYDLSVQESAEKPPVNLIVIQTPGSDEISILGKGFDEFATLDLGEGRAKTSSRADWAGNLQYEGKLQPGTSNKPDSFRVAFYGNDIGAVIAPNPKIIQVFEAPGGGSFSPGGALNRYSNLYCESLRNGMQVPATCRPSPVLADNNRTVQNYVRAMIMMGHQFSVVMMKQMAMLGKMLDAKEQLEVQTWFQMKAAEAHKDYHPSDTMCRFGSFIKSVPRAEARVRVNKEALNSVLMASYTNLENTAGDTGAGKDFEARVAQFRRVYCDPRDNNNGLTIMCDHDQNLAAQATVGAAFPGGTGAPRVDPNPPPPQPGVAAPWPPDSRINKDIDYTRTADFPLTLNVDFTDSNLTRDEEDIIALGKNIYWPEPFNSVAPNRLAKNLPGTYLNERNIFAMQNVAHNSFLEIAGLKSRTDPRAGVVGLENNSGWNFMKSMMREFGLTDPEIHQLLGEYPSYYAQMEVLTKKMYQNPDFYTNLYDKPVNIDRINVAMEALRVIQQRDQYESRLRQEMLTSLMVEEALAPKVDELNGLLGRAVRNP